MVRLRRLETQLHARMDEAVNTDNPVLLEEFPRRFKAWMAVLEQMRKMEGDLLEVLEKRKELIRMSDVREWAVRNALGVKTRFLALPTMLAPRLDQKPWQAIQEEMGREIRGILVELSETPGG